MPPSAGTLRVGRYFGVLLALLAVLYGLVFWPGQRHTPKLGLDLEGGAQVVLQAKTPDGKTPSKSSMITAQTIINDRVNGLGVAAAQVQIQGGDRIVVSVPGATASDLVNVGKPYALNFRPVMADVTTPNAVPAPSTPTASASASASASKTATAKPSVSNSANSASASATPSPAGRVVPHLAGSATPSASTSAAPSASKSASPAPAVSPSATTPTTTTLIDQWKGLSFAPPKDAVAYKALTAAQQAEIQARATAWNCNNTAIDNIGQPLIACDEKVSATTGAIGKYLLGAVIVQGKEVSGASALAPGTVTGQSSWTINLSLKSTGQKQWADYTRAHNAAKDSTDIAATVAYVVDGKVTQAAQIQSVITGDTQVTGNFGAKDAKNFANSLKYGALPLTFTAQESQSVSATLGTQQLKSGLLAGGIGLLLVVIYSLLYYRALGLVTIASLVVSGLLTYALLVILGTHIGLTLTLAGIAGFIVAVGITADSFVVFFERIKDEVHEGRTARVAIPRAWDRSKRTILSADAVSFLAAATLYYFAAGDVKGFAFTLGLSTVLDLVVVFLFTHPIVSLFSRSAAFGSAKFTGLNHVRVGGIASYRSSERGRRPSRQATMASQEDYDNEVPDQLGVGDEPDEELVTTPTNAPRAAADEPAANAPVTQTPSPATTPTQRSTASKASGSTAAERAAARRARTESGTDTTGQGDNS